MAVVILGDSYNDRVDSTSSILVPQEDLQLTSADTIPSTSSLIFSSPPVSFDSTRLESSSTIVFTGGGGGGVTDHGFLTGRADDDHVQYALLVGRGGDTLHIDDIDEYTADAGVTVESVVLEDGGITLGTGATVDTIETVVTDDDTHLSTSGAIVDYVATQVATVNQFTE